MNKHFIVGTAGHVDHGKTTLIRALTGIETDRLPEEQARGLSIDLGFAHLNLPGNVVAGIVDVPGHQRFLKNMLAGVGGYDCGLLVVDAQEGVMPQTREHVEILELLQTGCGLVVLTKIDTVDAEFLELVQDDLRDYLKDTFLAEAPMVAVSAKTGEGLDKLRTALGSLLSKRPARSVDEPFRLPVDRAFLKPGFGTVVTGSLWSGRLRKGDALQVLPADIDTKVRDLQVHGINVEEAVAGQRVAVNLAGVEPGSVDRGQILSPPGLLSPTQRIDVRLEVLGRVPRPVKHRARVRFYAGTAEAFGRVLLLEGDTETGNSRLAQIELDSPVAVQARDRFILRDFTASYTIGGGEVLTVAAERHKRADDQLLEQLRSQEKGGFDQSVIGALGNHFRNAVQLGTALQVAHSHILDAIERLVAKKQLVALGKNYCRAEVFSELEEKFQSILIGLETQMPWKTGWRKEELLKLVNHDPPKLAEEVLAAMVEQGTVQERGRFLSSAGHEPRLNAAQQSHLSKAVKLLRDAGYSPPSWEDVAGLAGIEKAQWKLLEPYMIDTGLVVRVAAPDIYYLVDMLDAMPAVLAPLVNFTPAQARDVLGTTRKYIIPLLEYLDSKGITHRQGDERRLKVKKSSVVSDG